jgi:hypothetical protein
MDVAPIVPILHKATIRQIVMDAALNLNSLNESTEPLVFSLPGGGENRSALLSVREGASILDRLAHYAMTGDPRVLVRSVFKHLGTFGRLRHHGCPEDEHKRLANGSEYHPTLLWARNSRAGALPTGATILYRSSRAEVPGCSQFQVKSRLRLVTTLPSSPFSLPESLPQIRDQSLPLLP